MQVGEYVEYNYNAPEGGYTTPATTTEDYVDSENQTFSSKIATVDGETNGNAAVTNWRVLSKKDGIVKLVAETPISTTLTLNGAKGWVNGPKVLDEMCKTLYSSDIGTARSINVEDVNEVTGYEIPEKLTDAAYDADYEPMEIAYGTTIAEAAKTAGSDGAAYDMLNFTSNTPEEGKDIGDYELTYYTYKGVSQMDTTVSGETDKYKMLFRKLDDSGYMPTYWLESSCIRAFFYVDYAQFRVRCVSGGDVLTSWLYDSGGGTHSSAYAVRPVVTLKSGLEIDGGDGSSAATAWQIKGN